MNGRVIAGVAVVAVVLAGIVDGRDAYPAPPVRESHSCTASSAEVVVCVDASTQTASVLYNGTVLFDLGTVTTSRVDTDCPRPRVQYVNCGGVGDHITPTGRWAVSCTDPRTGTRPDPCNPVSAGLRYLMQFPNGTAWNTSLHQYPQVGAGYDSHGCVRVRSSVARRLFDLVNWWRAHGGRVIVEVQL